MSYSVYSPGFIYRCITCGSEYDSKEIIYLCRDCNPSYSNTELPPSGVLKVLYDYHSIAHTLPADPKLACNVLSEQAFLPLLPLTSITSFPPLRIGQTPLFRYQAGKPRMRLPGLFIKDDGLNPTFSFKDRASALVSAFARERGIDTIVAASTGNAGSSIAGICASQGQKAVVMVPETAPPAKLAQIVMYGARIVPVKGSYDEAYDLSVAVSNRFGWYNRNTAYNPLTVEGKKTVAFEMFAQCGYKVPDRIFVSAGDGVIVSGIYKGFEDLMMLQLSDHMPVVVVVQAEGSDNLVRNLNQTGFVTRKGTTIADSICVDVPRNFYMARQYIHSYNGEPITVCDDAIIEAISVLAKNTGVFTEPASAAAFAGYLQYHRQGKCNIREQNVVLLTGSGLKDLKAISAIIKIPQAIKPDINHFQP